MSGNGYYNGRPDAEYWTGEIRRALAFRKKHAQEASWPRWRDYYRNRFQRGVLPVNLYFRMLRTVVPRIYFRNPSISVQASKPGPEQAAFAQLIERIDNKLMRSMRMKDQLKKIVHQTWMFGTGIGRRGFAQQFKPDVREVGDGSAPVGGSLNLKMRAEYHQNISDNMPWFLKVNTGDFLVPADTQEFEEARWNAMWVRRPLSEVQNDPRLRHTADLRATPPGARTGVDTPSDGRTRVDMLDMVEIHDYMTGKVFVMAPYNNDKVLLYADDPLQQNNRGCFYRLVFNDDDEAFWGLPDAAILEPQQLELNEIRTLEMKHRRMSLLKLLYKKGSINLPELEKLLNGEVSAAVEILGELSDIDHFQVADIPNGLRIQGAEVLNDVREGMGFSRNQSGNFSDATSNPPTATESRIVQMASEIRIDERRDMLADMIVDVFEDIHADIFTRWKEDMILQVMGPSGVPLWVAFKPSDLKAARYDMQIDPDSTVPETKEFRMQKAIMTYERLKLNPLIDPDLLTRYFLRELHGVQFDNMIKQLQMNAAAGVQGATPTNPLTTAQYVEQVARSGGGGGAGLTAVK